MTHPLDSQASPTKTVAGTIPVVDMRDWLEGDDASRAQFVSEVGDALREYGFLRVRGHAIRSAQIQPAYDAARALFALPTEQKMAYCVRGGAGERGYTPFGAEHAKGTPMPDLKEFWHVGRELADGHPLKAAYPANVWPAEVESFRADLLSLYDGLEAIALEMLVVIAMYLGEEPSRIVDLARDGNSILRALHYPPLANVEIAQGAVRAAAHEDINLITLLVTSSHSGLEILRRDGVWMSVNAEDGEILMDAGDMLGRITHGVIAATTHRVVNPTEDRSERFSMPFFVHPRPDAVLRVLDTCRNVGNGELPPDITGYAFLRERLAEIGLHDM